MSAAPSIQPFFDDTADVVILSDKSQHIHLVPDRHREQEGEGAPSEASPWVGSPLRRCFDVMVAAIGLVMASPIMALAAALVYLSTPGPILFRQSRTGRYRKPFTLYKFRSMRMDHLAGPVITVEGDPRITGVGAFLRRYKLDELPQLWNVLRGDLSLVGPRPKLPHHEALDLPYRPGLTGLATLAFRNEETILSEIASFAVDEFYEQRIKPRKAELDREYMRRASFWSDMALIWQTATACLLGPDELPEKEAESLRRLALEWPHPASAEEEDRSDNYLANYFARVELHGARWPSDYRKLDEALKKHGFERCVQAGRRGEDLATAFYYAENRVSDLLVVANAVKACADRSGFKNDVLVIKSAGSQFYASQIGKRA